MEHLGHQMFSPSPTTCDCGPRTKRRTRPASAPLRDDTSDAIPATCRHPMLCRRLTGRGGRPRRGSPTRRRFSCGQLVRLGRSGQEDHHIRWHTAADAVCAPTQAPVSKSNACVTALTARRRLPQTLNTNAHAPALTTLVCANSMRRATFEADSPRRRGACARV